jgi:hypothetical protein
MIQSHGICAASRRRVSASIVSWSVRRAPVLVLLTMPRWTSSKYRTGSRSAARRRVRARQVGRGTRVAACPTWCPERRPCCRGGSENLSRSAHAFRHWRKIGLLNNSVSAARNSGSAARIASQFGGVLADDALDGGNGFGGRHGCTADAVSSLRPRPLRPSKRTCAHFPRYIRSVQWQTHATQFNDAYATGLIRQRTTASLGAQAMSMR